MGLLRLAVWRKPGDQPDLIDCPKLDALVAALAERKRTHLAVLHCLGETVRKPTAWEAKASTLLATMNASHRLNDWFEVSTLPDDLDSDLLALAVHKEVFHPRDDLIRRAEAAVERLPADASEVEVARAALKVAGDAPVRVKRRLLEVVGISKADVKVAVTGAGKGNRQPRAR